MTGVDMCDTRHPRSRHASTGMSSGDAIGALSSDLAFSISFAVRPLPTPACSEPTHAPVAQVGQELLASSREASITEDELVAMVLSASLVLGSIPRAYRHINNELVAQGWLAKPSPKPSTRTSATVTDFAVLMLDILRRVVLSLSVQLLAQNVRARQPERTVRVLSLLSVSVFFLFIDASSSIGMRSGNR